jgi:hypothetical protein
VEVRPGVGGPTSGLFLWPRGEGAKRGKGKRAKREKEGPEGVGAARLAGEKADMGRIRAGGRPQGSGGAAGVTHWISAGIRRGSAEMRDRGIRGGR